MKEKPGAAYVIGRMVYDGQRAEQWVRVRATVDSYGHGTVAYRAMIDDPRALTQPGESP